MKRVFGLLLVLAALLVLSASVLSAVELQQGWYARFGFVDLGSRVPAGDHMDEWLTQWLPASALVTTGPILVQQAEPAFHFGRSVSISANTQVSPGVVFEDVGAFTFQWPYYQYVSFSSETYYDANIMQLQILRRRAGSQDELLWAQSASWHVGSGMELWPFSNIISGDQIVFRVVALPEPSGIVGVVVGVAFAFSLLRRRPLCA
jgi:hypothetical protein